MYTFKSEQAEAEIRNYLRMHPNSKTAAKALNGDCAAMMELYEKLCGPKELEEGPTDAATMILEEAVNCKYTPALIRIARVEMCVGIEYWPDAIKTLKEAYELGDKRALFLLQDNWENCVKDADEKYKKGEYLNRYEECVLAFYYYYGIGTPQDETMALRLFQSAAKRQCDEAREMLRNIQSPPSVLQQGN